MTNFRDDPDANFADARGVFASLVLLLLGCAVSASEPPASEALYHNSFDNPQQITPLFQRFESMKVVDGTLLVEHQNGHPASPTLPIAFSDGVFRFRFQLAGAERLLCRLCILNGMICDRTEHGTATQQFHTGMPVLPRPSLGAWLMYGLGTENQNMPGFVVISPPAGSNMNCGTDFLPGIYQSTILQDADKVDSETIRYLLDKRLPRSMRRSQLEFLQELNANHAQRSGSDPDLESMIEANELAFRMQSEAPQVLDLESETAETHSMYGIGEKETDAFGRQCLLARRLAEADVRFIQVTSKQWDHHDTIEKLLPASCHQVDKPIAGLLADLKARGLLDDTLVVWSGEFGRTPVYQQIGGAKAKSKPPGRGHNPFGWSLFMAGGGVKPGFKYGATDEVGYSAVEGRVHIHDFHATVLHLLGLDHERLTFLHAGRPYRLTDVYGTVVNEVLA
ncbi:DUF1501 domain-containing protein [Stieleria sp. TO1_6]|nr:DUF1501 domain-containing protein [Stieleria tagensis]